MSGPGHEPEAWDLFCRVVDNYGDIGIAWRLARQIASDARDVRLIVDGLEAFARIEPRIDPARDRQCFDGITVVRRSSMEETTSEVASVVIELLGCGLPAHYIDAMVERVRPPIWIDFEHLSAEPWVEGFHGLPSPHPVLPLTKHFFYPGFGTDTGGLLVEPGLEARRRAFLDAPDQVDALWRRLGVPPPADGERRIALFAYPDAPVDALRRALSNDRDQRWSLLVPGGLAGSTPVLPIPFVDQDDFDRLLWASDVNFVRGEDSFVRAQVAGRPFVWQIYRQPDEVHLQKLAAFADRYEATLSTDAATAQRAMWSAWNGRPDELPFAAKGWLKAMPALRSHAETWRLDLAEQSPLIERLLAFVEALKRVAGDQPVC